MTLEEFLLARIAEDEELAGDTAAEHYGGAHGGTGCCDQSRRFLEANTAARVLAECEAKRRRVELHIGPHECRAIRTGTYPPDADLMGETPGAAWRHAVMEYVAETVPCPTMRLDALPYADHPDYDPEWRP